MKWRLINNHCCECPVTSDTVSSLGKFPSLTLEDWHELLVNSNVFLEHRVWFSKFQQKIRRWKESKNSCLGTNWAPTRGTVEICCVLKISSKSTYSFSKVFTCNKNYYRFCKIFLRRKQFLYFSLKAPVTK